MTGATIPTFPGTAKTDSRRQKRRKAILESARLVFLEQGYEAASMSEIVERAGGSLTTLYSLFGDKRGLFFAMLEDRLLHITSEMTVQLSEHTPIKTGLTRIGRHFVTTTVETESVEMYRLIIGLAPQFPDIAKSFLEQGPEQVRKRLADYLFDRQNAGEIEMNDYLGSAALFLEMVRSGLSLRVLLDISYRPTEEEISVLVDKAVTLFLKVYGVDQSA